MKRTLISAAVAAAAMLSAPVGAQGMMGGYGPGYGMGPGMMGGYGPGHGYSALNLSTEQRARLADIEREVSRKQWDVMKKMHDQDFHMHDLFGSGAVDETRARKTYQVMSEAHKEMFETMLEARKRIDSVLTPEQREQLRRSR